MFKPTLKKNKPYDVIMVGGWSYRKGCDLIIEAMKQMKLKFLHVGSIVDIPFPTNIPHFTYKLLPSSKNLSISITRRWIWYGIITSHGM